MTPGALSDLVNRVQTLEAQVRRNATTSTTSSGSTSTSTTTTTAGLTPTWLASAQSWSKAGATLTLDNAWHTLAPTGLPSTVKVFIIDGYVRNDGSPDNADQELNFRSDSSGISLYGAKTRGVSSNYSNEQAFQLLVPASASGTFDYLFSASLATAVIRVIGYWS
jgi:hypothetical protein